MEVFSCEYCEIFLTTPILKNVCKRLLLHIILLFTINLFHQKMSIQKKAYLNLNSAINGQRTRSDRLIKFCLSVRTYVLPSLNGFEYLSYLKTDGAQFIGGFIFAQKSPKNSFFKKKKNSHLI